MKESTLMGGVESSTICRRAWEDSYPLVYLVIDLIMDVKLKGAGESTTTPPGHSLGKPGDLNRNPRREIL